MFGGGDAGAGHHYAQALFWGRALLCGNTGSQYSNFAGTLQVFERLF